MGYFWSRMVAFRVLTFLKNNLYSECTDLFDIITKLYMVSKGSSPLSDIKMIPQ